MTPVNLRERLQPSLLDRLCDDAPGNPKESAEQWVLTASQLKASVLRDLTWLLNTTALLDSDTSRHSAAGTSVVNFGLPALTGTSLSSIDVDELEQAIRRIILAFEPRILASTLQVRARRRGSEMNHNALRFEIEGDLWSEPVPLRLLLQSELDLESGQFQLSSADARSRR